MLRIQRLLRKSKIDLKFKKIYWSRTDRTKECSVSDDIEKENALAFSFFGYIDIIIGAIKMVAFGKLDIQRSRLPR